MELHDENLARYLEDIGERRPDEAVRVVASGDGNINFVRRVAVGERALVVKQARPALERFPEYRVTTERIVFEHRYGEIVTQRAGAAAGLLPRVHHFDPSSRVLVMEDLGPGPRLDDALAAGSDVTQELDALGAFLGAVHAATRDDAPTLAKRFANDEMRALHGEHIFTLPYEPNDFPVAPAVKSAGERALARPGVRTAIAALRERYYGLARALVHADVQGTNILLREGRPRLVDAEIAHVGDPAFDLGIALAHVEVHELLGARPSRPGGEILRQAYCRAGGLERDLGAASRHAAVELLRRTLGAARFGFPTSEDQALALIGAASDRLAGD